MNRTDYQGMCLLSKGGQLIWVENTYKHIAGRVTGCDLERVEVDAMGQLESWRRSERVEITHGYKLKYREYLKYPSEYDTHLD